MYGVSYREGCLETRSRQARKVKMLMVGDCGIGKSSFLHRFVDEVFSPTHITTIGVDFRIKRLGLGGELLKLFIWDTAGPERFVTLSTAYYRGADGIFVMFNLCDRRTFEHVLMWMGEIEKHAGPGVVMQLVGLRDDCDSDTRQVSSAEAGELARSRNIEYTECSSKTGGDRVDAAVCKLAKRIQRESPFEPPPPPVEAQENRKCCVQ